MIAQYKDRKKALILCAIDCNVTDVNRSAQLAALNATLETCPHCETSA
jgi:hypothetical protein